MAATDPPTLRKALAFYEQAVALDPGFAQAWARVSRANSLLYGIASPTPALAERARQAAEKARRARARTAPRDTSRSGTYDRLVVRATQPRARELLRAKGAPRARQRRSSRCDAACRASPRAAGIRRSAHCEAGRAPRSATVSAARSGWAPCFCRLRRYPRGDRGTRSGPRPRARRTSSHPVQGDGVSRAGRPGRRPGASSRPRPRRSSRRRSSPTGDYNDLVWVLDEEQRDLLLRLTPSAFDDDRGAGALPRPGLRLEGRRRSTRIHAEEARRSSRSSSGQRRMTRSGTPSWASLSPTWAEKKEAIREGRRAVALMPVAKDAPAAPTIFSTSSCGSTSSPASRRRRSTSSSRC